MADAAVTIIGGGVVGLAVAAEISTSHSPLFLLERHARYGTETSSRNSEVIHAGIYYPPGSLRARLCVEGRDILYRLCEQHEIPHRKITKIVTATSPDELGELELIYERGRQNGAPLERLTPAQVHALEPNIVTHGGLFSPTTGIISAHGIMDYFAHVVRERGGVIQTNCRVVGIGRRGDDYEVTVEESGQKSSFSSAMIVNAAGLESDHVAAMAGIDVEAAGYRLVFTKGSYFSLPSSYRSAVSRLVYPAPTKDSLGVHVVLDLTGRLKFGPDVETMPSRIYEYSVDETKRAVFAASVRRILPGVRDEELMADMCGIRPRLKNDGKGIRDFVICEESARNLPGFVNLIGIESPGLTAAPAIAKMVAGMLA